VFLTEGHLYDPNGPLPWPCSSCGFSSSSRPSVLDKLEDPENLKVRVKQAREARERQQEVDKQEAWWRERESFKYRCPGCREVIILTPGEYKRGLGYAVRPRSSYDCPYCAENDSAYRDEGHKGFFRRIIDWFTTP